MQRRCTRAGRPARSAIRPIRLGGLCALVLGLLSAPPVSAQQQGSVGGIVVSKGSQQPLAGAQVVVEGTGNGTLTGEDGRFLIPGLSGGRVTLRVEMIGYAPATQVANVGQLDVRIELSQSAIELNQIVVTGTPGAAQKKSIGNVVSTLDAANIVGKAPVTSVNDIINGRTAGVTVLSSTGEVGGASKVRIRGSSTFSLSNAPLVYIDGIRVNNDETSGPINQGFGSQSISRWNDIDPNDIESIEIIKGPAAATLYGTEAANGVVQIITKKGRQGQTHFNLQVKQGANWFANPSGRLWTNYGMVNDQLTSIDFDQLQQNYQQYLGGDKIFHTGHLQSYDLSMSGGSETVQYFISGNYEHNKGVEPTNQVKKGSGRLNLTVTPNSTWRINGNFGYVNGRTDLACESGCGGVTWTTYYMTPLTLADTMRYGFYSGTPESYHALFPEWQDVGRFTGSIQINNDPAKWFSQRLTFGIDRTNEQNHDLELHDERYLYYDSFADRGYADVVDRQVNYATFDYSGTLKLDLLPGLQSNTSFGAQYYRKHIGYQEVYGEAFPVPGLTSVSATTQNRIALQDYTNNTTVGVFGQEQFAWQDRRFLTLALRADDNSAFGQNFDLVYYPKISGAWVLSDEPFFKTGFINTFRLRAAYGESGQQPTAFAALKTFSPVTGPNDAGTVTPNTVGNPDLGPERSREIEAGFDAGFLQDRLGIEFTYYNQQTRDAILSRQIAPSTGFAGSQFVNAGRIDNSGIELTVRGTPYAAGSVRWDASFNIATNHNEVISLGNVTDENFITGGTYIRHQIGDPVGAWFGKKIVSAALDADGNAINLMCATESGGSVDCADAPNVFLGRNQPKVEGGFNSTVTLFNNLQLFGQLDFKTGFKKLDGNLRVRCFFFDRCRENYVPQDYDPVYIAEIQNGYQDVLISDASFAKLRELSATYTLPTSLAGKIGARGASLTVAGRNLMTWTNYSGLEPEATFNGGSRGGDYSLWEQDVLPQLAQFVATVNVSW